MSGNTKRDIKSLTQEATELMRIAEQAEGLVGFGVTPNFLERYRNNVHQHNRIVMGLILKWYSELHGEVASNELKRLEQMVNEEFKN